MRTYAHLVLPSVCISIQQGVFIALVTTYEYNISPRGVYLGMEECNTAPIFEIRVCLGIMFKYNSISLLRILLFYILAME